MRGVVCVKDFAYAFFRAGMIAGGFVLCKIVVFNWIATFPEIGPVPLSVAAEKCNMAYGNLILWGWVTAIILPFSVGTAIKKWSSSSEKKTIE